MQLTTAAGLLQHSASIMEKLDKGKVSVEIAKAQASLLKQSNNLLRFELDEKKFEIKLKNENITPTA